MSEKNEPKTRPKKPVVPWQNRIVDKLEINPKELKANQKNWRLHPEKQAKALEAMLDDVGWVRDIVMNKTTGNLIDGHLRVDIAIKRKQTTVPVSVVELSEEEELKVLLFLDMITSMVTTAKEDQLKDLIESVHIDDESLRLLMNDLELRYLPPEEIDVNSLWVGMPEYKSEWQLGIKSVYVHFETWEDVKAFAELVNQKITEKTKYIWYPEQKSLSQEELGYKHIKIAE